MPTSEHELPLEMVRNRPQLVPTILRTVFGLDMPYAEPATLTSESYADLNPAELRCDATVLLDDPETPTHGVVVESQLRFKADKLYSWPAYLALLRNRRKCPVTLLVFCRDQAGARACGAPIDMGHPGWVLTPLTVHPGLLPPITDTEEARRLPELAILGAPAHANPDGPHTKAVLTSVKAALDEVHTQGGDNGRLYYDYLMTQLCESARKVLEGTMNIADYEWQSDFAKTHQAEGEARGEAMGEAKSVLLFLSARGIDVPDDIRERVTSCTDTEQLDRWVKRAAVINTAEDLFD
ncbi:hypothetical protein [Actinomadura sp. 6K520]|uniref:hypothetical protein n=1 Tax=Actinomadura sp. 6K520 TaxID=2530364 RepID=UPI0010504E25|nr:hypothetical protein [Actinomadura sp. 6K520]TDE32239.1 hypothetical protein E1289_16200 [Actinomadura sp. 6K520]